MPEAKRQRNAVFYQQSGDGPDVVLVHAVTSNQAVWVFTGLVDARRRRVSRHDLRPARPRRQRRPPTGYTSAAMAEDFRQLHAALGLKPAFLVGHSFGGVVGMHAAALAPECVAGVMLSDSFFPGLEARRAELRQDEHLGRSARDVRKSRRRTRRNGGLRPPVPRPPPS